MAASDFKHRRRGGLGLLLPVLAVVALGCSLPAAAADDDDDYSDDYSDDDSDGFSNAAAAASNCFSLVSILCIGQKLLRKFLATIY
jgi:hypothetical protein